MHDEDQGDFSYELCLTCWKGHNDVMNVRAASLKLPPKVVADDESVCMTVN